MWRGFLLKFYLECSRALSWNVVCSRTSYVFRDTCICRFRLVFEIHREGLAFDSVRLTCFSKDPKVFRPILDATVPSYHRLIGLGFTNLVSEYFLKSFGNESKVPNIFEALELN